MTQDRYQVLPGDSGTLGARYVQDGVNFACAVPQGKSAELVIVSARDEKKVLQRIPLTKEDCTGDVCAVRLSGVGSGEIGYYYEIDGRPVPDPYASQMIKGICYLIPETYDWEGDTFPDISIENLMIYKLHVRGFTKKAKKIRSKGTFRGLNEAIPYISSLGFNAVELMPMYEWDDSLRVRPYTEETVKDGEGADKAVPLKNYWGYSATNYYFSPKALYAATDDPSGELRDLIKNLHRNGIELIMEMYFPEGTDLFMAMLAIRFWKSRYRIAGFHFVGGGTPVSAIMRDPLLSRTKLYFEYVDPEEILKVSPGRRRNILVYRDDFEHTARALVKGDEGKLEDFVRCIRQNPPTHGYVNYAANVNGFTLYDAVCYDRKHNEKNGEDNHDGTAWNYSWNCGVEGPSKKKQIRALRMKQVRNLLLYTFLAQGTPLLLAGDEGCNTQGGNNNAYASDDTIGWTDWSTSKDADDLRNFVTQLAAFRKDHPILHMPRELKGTDYRSLGCPDISFHDSKAWVCSLENASRTLAVMYNGLYTSAEDQESADAVEGGEYCYVAYNAFWDAHPFALPALPQGWSWYPAISSAKEAGNEFAPKDVDACENQKYCEAPPRSVIVLIGRPNPASKKKGAKRSGKGRKKKA